MVVVADRKRWSLFEAAPVASASLIMASSGSVYLVAAYSSKLQKILGMTTVEIAAYGTLVAAGSWLGIVPMAYTDRFGPKSTALIGIFFMCVGYILVGCAASGAISMSSGAVIFCGFIIGHGSSWTNAAALVTNTSNTSPKSRGAVIGLLQANFALSSGIYTQILEVFDLSIPVFLITTGILTSVSILVAFPSNHRIDGKFNGKNLKTDTLYFVPLAILTTLTAIFVATSSIFGTEALHIIVLILFGVLCLFVFDLSIKMSSVYGLKVLSLYASFDKQFNDQFEMMNNFGQSVHISNTSNNKYTFTNSALGGVDDGVNVDNNDVIKVTSGNEHNGGASAGGAEYTRLLGDNNNSDDDDDGDDDENDAVSSFLVLAKPESSRKNPNIIIDEKEKSYTLVDSMKTIRFWLLFFCFAVGVGTGLTVLDNVSKIVDAHSASGSDDDVHSSLKTNAVALFSAFNTLGRVGFGFVSDWLSVHKGISRAWLLCFNCLLMGAATMYLAYATLSTINYAVMLTAISYGGFWLLVPALVADLYGFVSYGAILGMISFAPTIGAELFYNIMSTVIYDDYGSGDATCFDNAACFKLTFIILSGLCFLSAVFAIITAHLNPE